MNNFLSKVRGIPRLLMDVELAPVQGVRFFPTNFPNLGAAEYETPSGEKWLLVESVQSMANRLEEVIWDSVNEDIIAPLKGMSYVRGVDKDGNFVASSILEAHRLNDGTLMDGKFKGKTLKDFLKENIPDKPFRIQQLEWVLWQMDAASLLHGVFLEKIHGVARLPRSLSGFIEARNVRPVYSGGVKFDRLNPEGKGGKGNVPYSRVEYVANEIKAYFNIDVQMIQSFPFSQDAKDFLIILALYKIRRFLERGLRLRSACDLVIKGDLKTANDVELPETDELEKWLADNTQTIFSNEKGPIEGLESPVTVVVKV